MESIRANHRVRFATTPITEEGSNTADHILETTQRLLRWTDAWPNAWDSSVCRSARWTRLTSGNTAPQVAYRTGTCIAGDGAVAGAVANALYVRALGRERSSDLSSGPAPIRGPEGAVS